MNLFQIKIRRFVYLSLGIALSLSVVAGIFAFFIHYIKSASIIDSICIAFFSILVIVPSMLILGLIETMVDKIDDEVYTFLFGYVFMTMPSKLIYHSELGYFLCIIRRERISVYDQSFFFKRYIAEIKNTGTHKEIAQKIKEIIDYRYDFLIEEKREAERIKQQFEEVAKWDGFLDQEGRIDEKIKRLIR